MHIVLLKSPHIQMAFLKFTSCDNQAVVGCILIATVAVHLNLKSQKLVSHLTRYIAITYWIFKSLRQFQMPVQKSLEPYWMHHVYIYIHSISVCVCVLHNINMIFICFLKHYPTNWYHEPPLMYEIRYSKLSLFTRSSYDVMAKVLNSEIGVCKVRTPVALLRSLGKVMNPLPR